MLVILMNTMGQKQLIRDVVDVDFRKSVSGVLYEFKKVDSSVLIMALGDNPVVMKEIDNRGITRKMIIKAMKFVPR